MMCHHFACALVADLVEEQVRVTGVDARFTSVALVGVIRGARGAILPWLLARISRLEHPLGE